MQIGETNAQIPAHLLPGAQIASPYPTEAEANELEQLFEQWLNDKGKVSLGSPAIKDVIRSGDSIELARSFCGVVQSIALDHAPTRPLEAYHVGQRVIAEMAMSNPACSIDELIVAARAVAVACEENTNHPSPVESPTGEGASVTILADYRRTRDRQVIPDLNSEPKEDPVSHPELRTSHSRYRLLSKARRSELKKMGLRIVEVLSELETHAGIMSNENIALYIRDNLGTETQAKSYGKAIDALRYSGYVELNSEDGEEILSLTKLGMELIADFESHPELIISKGSREKLTVSTMYLLVEAIAELTHEIPNSQVRIGDTFSDTTLWLSEKLGINEEATQRRFYDARTLKKYIEVDETTGLVMVTQAGVDYLERVRAAVRKREKIPEPEDIDRVEAMTNACMHLAAAVNLPSLAVRLRVRHKHRCLSEYTIRELALEHAHIERILDALHQRYLEQTQTPALTG